MIKLSTIIATWFASGYIRPASGTWGTIAALPLCLVLVHWGGHFGIIFGSLLLFVVGLWAANCYEIETGEHDSSRVVIDEVVGMILASIPLLYSFHWITLLFCFLLFRLFDAVKIGLVGWADNHIHGAFGVMVDDVIAGLMASIVVLGFLLWMS